VLAKALAAPVLRQAASAFANTAVPAEDLLRSGWQIRAGTRLCGTPVAGA